jgi:hypothetical protein
MVRSGLHSDLAPLETRSCLLALPDMTSTPNSLTVSGYPDGFANGLRKRGRYHRFGSKETQTEW